MEEEHTTKRGETIENAKIRLRRWRDEHRSTRDLPRGIRLPSTSLEEGFADRAVVWSCDWRVGLRPDLGRDPEYMTG